MIPIPIASNMYEEDGNCDRNCDSNTLVGSAKCTDCFEVRIHVSLCMYMHRSTLVSYCMHDRLGAVVALSCG